MNPNCLKDIKSPECQNWMSLVCERCKELFATAATDVWHAWWHDTVPAIYKDVDDMTVFDCDKLKHLLQAQVAAEQSPRIEPKAKEFANWQKVALISTYIGILALLVWIWGYCRKARGDNGSSKSDVEKEPSTFSQADSCSMSSSDTSDATGVCPTPPHRPARKKGFKTWLRHRCRPIFLHNEATLRRQQKRYKEKEDIREAYMRQNIQKWAKTREEVEGKRHGKEKKDALESNGDT